MNKQWDAPVNQSRELELHDELEVINNDLAEGLVTPDDRISKRLVLQCTLAICEALFEITKAIRSGNE